MRRLLGSMILGAMALGGCAFHSAPEVTVEPVSEPRPVDRIFLGLSVEKRPIEMLSLGNGPDVVLMMATIHGNENAGTPILWQLARHLRQNPQLLAGRRVLIMPLVNPDGLSVNRRFNSRGIDLNRNFPATNRENSARHGMEALSEPESRIIMDVLEKYKPARIVSMHEPLEVVDWDGPAEDLAWHMGRYTVLPVERLGSRPGSLGSYAGETLGIPIVTFELPRDAGEWEFEKLWELYGQAMVAAVVYPSDAPPTRR